MKSIVSVSVLLAIAGPSAGADWSWNGDVRGGYYALDRDDRNGSTKNQHEWRLRLRAGLKAKFTDQLSADIRFAGKYSTLDSNHVHTRLFSSIPADDGVRRGDSTLDKLSLTYRPNQDMAVTLGRFQSKMELDGVAKKSLDRANSGNVDVTWVDGAYLTWKLGKGWKLHGILQRNYSSGSTEVRRGQLKFTDPDSGWSGFVAVENIQPLGAIVQRTLSLTYLPSALQVDGSAAGRIDDYIGMTGRISARWPLGSGGMKFQLSGEFGYAPNTPTKVAAKTGVAGDSNGVAYQVSFNFIDIVPKHSLGIVHGRAGAGWLLSPDFPNNMQLTEARYSWKFASKQKLEFRVRSRKDLVLRTGSLQKREDFDYYLRYTKKF